MLMMMVVCGNDAGGIDVAVHGDSRWMDGWISYVASRKSKHYDHVQKTILSGMTRRISWRDEANDRKQHNSGQKSSISRQHPIRGRDTRRVVIGGGARLDGWLSLVLIRQPSPLKSSSPSFYNRHRCRCRFQAAVEEGNSWSGSRRRKEKKEEEE
ncbi:unnamed protein product [Cercopithifilaria johnstoni]|uniref:Uncharacterized protein n=1 Tax=Cercopithifilaria johnstoni TaxID=2874296 RepID=A0A8J2PZ22_9BILA|nr:unnamed protein product [Cercopithifilaria johnstoni]